MSSQNKFKQDKGVSQAYSTSQKSHNESKKLVAPEDDFYTEWTTEKSSIENQKSEEEGNSLKLPTGKSKSNKHRITATKKKWSNSLRPDRNVSATYNEIYNRANLITYPDPNPDSL